MLRRRQPRQQLSTRATMTMSKPPQKTTTSTVDEPRRHGGTTVRDNAATPVPPLATATATSASSQDADDAPSPPPAPPGDDERLGLLANVVEGGDDYDEYDDNDDDYDYDDEDCEVGIVALPSPAAFLLARARANPRLTIATLLMGALTACLVTSDERFRPFAVLLRRFGGGDDDGGDCAGVGRDGRGRGGGGTPMTFPAFPARALLGIEMRGNRSSRSSSSSSPTTTGGGTTAAGGGEGGGDDAIATTSGRERRRRRRPPSPPYDPAADFRYERRGRERILAHWEEVVVAIGRNGDRRGGGGDGGAWTGIAAWGPCYPRADRRPAWPRRDGDGDDWPDIVRSNIGRIADGGGVDYPTVERPSRCRGGGRWAPSSVGGGGGEDLAGMCRPGFLIIGQGKCGTSSLYHYLTGHPRILPARQKQVDYFRNGRQLSMPPLTWYYSNFPTIESFLGRGALMTGEASPGYMPYPSVVESVVRRLSPPDWRPYGKTLDDRDGPEAWKAQVRSLPKIIAIVRDPVNRARSSYKYNYVEPALSRLRAGKGVTVSGERIPPRMTDGYYRSRHLFSFEELAYAELVALRECLRSGGRGERWTHGELGASPDMFFYESLQRRNVDHRYSRDDAPPLVFLDEACYSETKHKLVPRVQWEYLAAEHPNKTLALPNLHLIQSIVGRGVYALPLEWWYEVFSSNSTAVNNGEEWIHVVCTEFLADDPQRTMADVTRFLGLPYFDFTNVTEVGRYNVDGNQGYDAITKSRDDDDTDDDPDQPQPSSHKGSWSADEDAADPLLAISDALMHELDRFYRPYNERLFRLIGKRCPWS